MKKFRYFSLRLFRDGEIKFTNYAIHLKILTPLLFILFTAASCAKKSKANSTSDILFDSVPSVHLVAAGINEASGIADSKKNPGNIWVEEDSGNPSQLFLLSYNGSIVKRVYLQGTVNRDWEDMALYDSTIYLADIGDNNQTYKEYTFYIFTEPLQTTDTVKNIKAVSFVYPDGSHDAEAFLLDKTTKDIYIITKRDNPSRIYKLTYPYADVVTTATLVGQLDYGGVVSAASSNDEKEIIIKTYVGLNYYTRKSGQTVVSCLTQKAKAIPYTIEPQGEAVCFAQKNNGYFTLSEKGFASSISLYFYLRK